MIDRLLRLITGNEIPTTPTEDNLRLALAALLVEAGRMAEGFSKDERAAVADLLSKRFGLSAADVLSLIDRADERVSQSAQYFPFIHAINQSMSVAEKVEVIEMLWRIAYADGRLDAHEDQLIRQIAGLIHVPDRDRMLARKRVLGLD